MAITKNETKAAADNGEAQKPQKLSDVPGQPDTLAPATDVAASGALIEPTIVERIDTSHPAVDNEPRKGTTKASNQIDFNDPTLTLEEAVEENLTGSSND